MKALMLLILLLYAAQTVGQVNIDDSLTGPSLNTTLWSFEANAPGNGTVSFDATRGMALTIQPGVAARGIGSTCSLAGDFDVQVGINLINWPTQNLYGLRLGAVDLGTGPFGEVGIYREGGGEFYTVAFTSGSVHTATTNSDKVSVLRLKRVGSTLSGYFLSGGVWVQVGGAAGNGATTTGPTRFNLDISSSNPNAGGVTVAFNNFHVNSGSALCVPTGLHATVGNQTVDLVWDASRVPTDSYKIYRDECASCSADATVNLVTTTVAGTQQTFTSSNLVNGQLYRYTVTAIKNGIESFHSNFVLARPGEFAVSQPPPRPPNPIILLHGILSDASTWNTTANFFVNTLHWKLGGTLSYQCAQDPRDNNTFPQLSAVFDPNADLYAINFGENLANYGLPPFRNIGCLQTPVGRQGLLHQTDEVQGFIRFIEKHRATKDKFSIVAHSMGGLPARQYVADNLADPVDNSIAVERVSQLITYGTPHWGVSPGNVLEFPWLGPFISFIGNPFVISRGARDLRVDCTILNSDLDYSQEPSEPSGRFLDQLRLKILPNQVQYSAIRGQINKSQVLTPCLSQFGDGLITIDSANLGSVPEHAPPMQPALTTNPVSLLTTDRSHNNETSDFSAILCALEVNCALFIVRSPVDIEITAPDGRSIARQLSEIPAASYMEPADETGHQIATVLVPFPLGGDYTIRVVPKAGAAPTDTYTLEIVRAGVTTIVAQNQMVQDIPAQPYVVTVQPPVHIDIKPRRFPNIVNLRRKTIPVAILSSHGFDAPSQIDQRSLTFGRTGNEQSLALCRVGGKDINGDRLPDLICRFSIRLSEFMAGDTQGVLKGRTVNDVPFVGTDSVRVTKPGEADPDGDSDPDF